MVDRRPDCAALERWCARAVPLAGFGDGLFDRIGRAIPFDGAFLATVDPATLLYTRAFRRSMPLEAGPAFFAGEVGADDVNQLRTLVAAGGTVGWLDRSTHGDRAASARYRTAMAPYGMGDELRTPLMVDGVCWGMVCLHRSAAVAGFAATEAALLGRLAPLLAATLRAALAREAAAAAGAQDDGPGVAVLDLQGQLLTCTPAGRRWLAELAELDRPPSGLPTVVRMVLAGLMAGVDPKAARARVFTASGRALTVHAAHLDDGTAAVVFEPITPVALAPLIIAAHGLTQRESQVAEQLCRGATRKAIATALQISLHTVNDHVKSVFDKTGVNSAGQLRAQLSGALAVGPSRPPS